MTLPRSLQAQLDEADRIVATLEGTTAQPAETPPTVEPTPTAPVAQPQAVAPQPTPVAPVEQPEETWKHKYHTLKGIFDASKTQLEGKLAEASRHADHYFNECARLTAELQRKAETPAPVARKAITDADRETFGAELVDLIERAAVPTVDPTELKQALQRINELEGKLGKVQTTQVESA